MNGTAEPAEHHFLLNLQSKIPHFFSCSKARNIFRIETKTALDNWHIYGFYWQKISAFRDIYPQDMDESHQHGMCPAFQLYKYSKAAVAMRSTSASFLASVKSKIAAKRLCCSFHSCNGSKLMPQLRWLQTCRKWHCTMSNVNFGSCFRCVMLFDQPQAGLRYLA